MGSTTLKCIHKKLEGVTIISEKAKSSYLEQQYNVNCEVREKHLASIIGNNDLCDLGQYTYLFIFIYLLIFNP